MCPWHDKHRRLVQTLWSAAKQTPVGSHSYEVRLRLDGIFAPASSTADDPNSICLLYSPYSCTATYNSYLANGGKGVNATYPACPANIQTALRAWISAGAFENSGVLRLLAVPLIVC